MFKLKRARAIKEVFYPQVDGQYYGGKEEKWEMESMYGLLEFE